MSTAICNADVCLAACVFVKQVGFHADHHLLLHGEPGSVPDGSEDGGAHRICRRPGRPDEHPVRYYSGRKHYDLLYGVYGLCIVLFLLIYILSSHLIKPSFVDN